MINAALNLLPNAVGQGRPQIIPAVVAPNTTRTPLPSAFSDSLFVTSPTDSESFWQVDDWPVEHGGTFPEAGAACALYYDANGALRCVWWDGVYSPPSPPVVTGSAWIAPTLINSWTVLRTVKYLRDPLGFVHVEGAVQSGSTGTVAFVLPAGYRPGQALSFAVTGSNVTLPCQAVLDTSGNVLINLNGASTLATVDQVNFLAEN